MAEVAASWAADEPGPAQVVFLRPAAGVEAVVVIGNVALGPARVLTAGR
jgi:glutamate dehydrogenase (NAD(P)+)